MLQSPHNNKGFEFNGGIRRLARYQLYILVAFVFFKGLRRLVQVSNLPEWQQTLLYSLPNFFEGVIGVLILSTIGLIINDRFTKRPGRRRIIGIAAILTGIYVILQETKVHNLGGENIYDPMDVVFSLVGICAGVSVLIIDWRRISND